MHGAARQKEVKELARREKKAKADIAARCQELIKPSRLKVHWSGGTIVVLKQSCWVDIREEARSGSWRGNGKIRCIVNRHTQDSKQFPERKNYDSWINAIAEHLVMRAKQRVAMAQSSESVKAAEAAAEEQVKKLKKLASAASYEVSPIVHSPSIQGKDGEYIPREANEITHVRVKPSHSYSNSLDLPFDKAEEFLQELKTLVDKYQNADVV